MKTLISDKLAVLKFIVIISIITIGMVLPSPSVAKDQNKSELIYELDFDKADLYFQMSEGYDVVGMKGCIFTRDVGKPQLPLKIVQYQIPEEMSVSRIDILDYTTKEVSGEYNIHPAPKSQMISETYEPTQPDAATYSSNQPYPADIIGTSVMGSLSGVNLAALSVYPVKYIPAQKKLILYTKIKFKIVCELTSQPSGVGAMAKAKKLHPTKRSEKSKKTLEKFFNNVIKNREEAKTWVSPGGLATSSRGDSLRSSDISSSVAEQPLSGTQTTSMPDTVDYVVITNEALIPCFEVLMQSKQQRGLSTFIETVSNIESAYPGRDTPEKIRNFIKDLYENHGLMWVLLGGDTNIIPRRVPYTGTPCDMYFSDLDGDWDGNCNNNFGEISDGLDLYPDVFVGRAPVENAAEATVFVNKILTYETLDDAYLNKALFIGGSSFNDCGGKSKDFIANNYMPEIFNITKLYQRNGTETRENVIRELNNGSYIVNHIDHAGTDVLKLGSEALTMSDVDSLTNGPRFSILWSCGCYPAAIDVDCIAEHWITNPNGGGVAFIGNSRFGAHPESDAMLDPEFYNSLFVSGIYNLGFTLAHSKLPFILLANRDETFNIMRYAMFELNLLGDPELSVKFLTSDATVRFIGEAFPIPSQPDILLVDKDLNVNPEIAETAEVYVISLTETTPEYVILTESGPNTSIFMGKITLQAGAPIPNDGILQAGETDAITVTYEETSPLGTKTDTAVVNGGAPTITELTSNEYITIDRVSGCVISWNTDEEALGTVTYRKASDPPNASIKLFSYYYDTHISFDIAALTPNVTYYCEISAIDRAGNRTDEEHQFIIIPPDISVTPTSLNASIPTGTMAEDALTISNNNVESVTLKAKFSHPDLIKLSHDGTEVEPDSIVEVAPGGMELIDVTIDASYLTEGTYSYSITITSNDLDTTTITLPVNLTVTPSPNVRYRCCKVIDDWTGRSLFCDGDQNIDPGEKDELSVVLRNFNTSEARNVTATLIYNGDPAYINVLDDASRYGDISPHAFAFPLLDGEQPDNFLFEISHTCPEGYIAPFTLIISDADSHIWQDEFSIIVTSDLLNRGPELGIGNRNGDGYPQISSDEQGGVYIVWRGSGNGIYFDHSTEEGYNWLGSVRLDNGSGSAANPQIASDEQGRVYVVWCEGGSSIYFNHSTDSGNTWYGEVRLDNGKTTASNPQISSDEQGHVYTVWYERVIFVCSNHSTNGGETWHGEMEIYCHGMANYPNPDINPQISSDEYGRVYVTWKFKSTNGSFGVYFSYSSNNGDTWQNKVLDNDTGNSYIPQLSSDNQGCVYVIWPEIDETLSFRYSIDSGNNWCEEKKLDNMLNGPPNPQISSDERGYAYIVWEDPSAKTISTCSISVAIYPDLLPIFDQVVEEGALLEFDVSALNPQGASLELFFDTQGIEDEGMRNNIETNSTFIDHGDGTGRFSWTPSPGSVGVYYPVVFVARDSSGRCDYQVITIGVTPAGYKGVLPGESIQSVIDGSLSGDSIYIFNDMHKENLQLQSKNLTLKGENASDTTIKGNISLADSNSTVENLTIQYNNTNELIYSNGYYADFKLLCDAGITAINSAITLKDCIIMPDPGIFGTAKFGKGIEIWNLYGSNDIAPLIENCRISNADTGIYLFSQAFGGAILGEIKNNTLDNNNYGITLRMHKEKPLIKDNEITNSINGIHITYKDGILLQERLNNIINNTFSGNADDIWCDELGE